MSFVLTNNSKISPLRSFLAPVEMTHPKSTFGSGFAMLALVSKGVY
ncbi:MAG: hypothetical protein ABI210_02555 [Abditibacteriaceae bacterium]